MKFQTMMVIKAAVCLVFGLLIFLAPSFVYSLFGADALNPIGEVAARQYSASLLGILLLTWFARNAEVSPARWAITLALCVYDALGFMVSLVAVLTGVLGPLGWSIVLLYLLLALGFGYLLVKDPRAVSA